MDALRLEIEDAITSVMDSLEIPESLWKKVLGPSREVSQGDLTMPCFPFAKILKKAPALVAEEICSALRQKVSIAEINSVNGYLNFKASPEWMASRVLSGDIHIGSALKNNATGKRVLIEHTSANPNGPFHVGRARNAILGDTIVRLNRLFGNSVRAEYYVDDMGKQVGVLAWALENLDSGQVEDLLSDREPLNPKWADKADHSIVRWYQAAQALRQNASDSEKEQIEERIGELVHASEHGDDSVLEQFEKAYQPVLDGMLTTLGRLGINFDSFTKESRFVVNGDVPRLIETLSKTEIHGEAENGAYFLDLGQRGMKGKKEFFYRRGDGSSLYATRDVAYHIWKWGECDTLINVLGEDHRLQAKQVAMTLTELGEKVPEVLFYAFIKLPEGKMSTRRGTVVFMDDLLEEAQERAAEVVRSLRPNYDQELVESIAEAVGVSAVRFNIIKVSPEKGFTFRWEDALAFEAGSAPFVMYSHTRACSIKSKVEEFDAGSEEAVIPKEMSESMVYLLRKINSFQDSLDYAVRNRQAHIFANYLLELANAYNGFYRDCHVIRDGKVDAFRFQVSESARKLLKASMEGLGIVPIERM